MEQSNARWILRSPPPIPLSFLPRSVPFRCVRLSPPTLAQFNYNLLARITVHATTFAICPVLFAFSRFRGSAVRFTPDAGESEGSSEAVILDLIRTPRRRQVSREENFFVDFSPIRIRRVFRTSNAWMKLHPEESRRQWREAARSGSSGLLKVLAECFEDCRPTVNFCNFLVQFAPRERTVTVSNNVVLLFDIPMAVCPIGFSRHARKRLVRILVKRNYDV